MGGSECEMVSRFPSGSASPCVCDGVWECLADKRMYVGG